AGQSLSLFFLKKMAGMQKEIGLNNVAIYNLSHGKSLPEWLKGRTISKRKLRRNAEYANRLELLQGFEFPVSCSRVHMTRDKQYFYASGIYRPVIKVFDVEQLSQKFERHTDCEVVQMHAIEDDYSKMVILGNDRTLQFHTRAGPHYICRMPRPGRDILYESSLCDLYAVGNSSQAYRLNLEQGRWMLPLDTTMESINCIGMAAAHHMLAFGGNGGVVECFDPRSKRSLATLAATPAGVDACEITALAFDLKGLSLAVGTSSGHVSLYDLRMSHPVLVKDHRCDAPIVGISYHGVGGSTMITADTKVVKIWSREDGKVLANIEPPAAINDLCVPDPDGGLLVLACEQPKIQTYYLPSLGPAPKWCSFLDNLTEELEEEQTAVIYDDFKFVTKEDVEKLGISKLVGTGVLRPYMHGYFMDIRLHQKINQLENPFAYEEYRKQKIQEKLKKQLDNRIALRKKPKASSLAANTTAAAAAAADSRFSAMLTRPELFSFDPEDPDFQKLRVERKRPSPEAKQGKVDEDEEGLLDSDEEDLESDDDDDEIDGDEIDEDDLAMYELDPSASHPLDLPVSEYHASSKAAKSKNLIHVPLGSRVDSANANPVSRTLKRTGNLEMSYGGDPTPEKGGNRKETAPAPQRKPRKVGRRY
ncbi:MAG: WD40 repeat domain-containing protein, partial [archaeon]|nr:WD40 repeat domain-containing protein [archaeon]